MLCSETIKIMHLTIAFYSRTKGTEVVERPQE
jgi:hypothetical protein